MAFGITRRELVAWKQKIEAGEIGILTHYWLDSRFPHATSVTKVGARDLNQLASWGETYGLQKEWIDHKEHFPHFDLFGEIQERVLKEEGMTEQYEKFITKKRS
ncbi:hypothetical protein MKY84_08620 [Chryseomicrobium sp. FSL W7-1435]|uniref:hypothetical protein n=1 Tax=Chryseomicrobium sp. FSL W7-1435 TaxID=2921704 RepID=UPI00315A75E8